MSVVATLEAQLTGDLTRLELTLGRAETMLQEFAAKKFGGARVDVEFNYISNGTKSSPAGIAKGMAALQSRKVEVTVDFKSNVTSSEIRTYASAINRLDSKKITVETNYVTTGTAPVIPSRTDYGSGGGGRYTTLRNQGYNNIASGSILTATATVPLAAAGGASLKFAGDFQEAMKLVGTMTDVGKKNIASLSQQVLALSKDPLVRSGPVELAEALYDVASKGLNAADSLKALKAAAMGTSAGLGDAKVIGKTLTDAGAAFGRTDFMRMMDTITVAVRKGGGEAKEYASAFSKVIPIASQAGVTFEEVAAQMASATRIGLKPSETATALRQIFNNLIDPSEKSKKAMKELGTSVSEVRAMLRDKGLFNTLKDLSERTGGRIGPITELFGNIRALTGFLATTGTNTLKEYEETLRAIGVASGDTTGAAMENSKGFNFQMDRLKNSAQALAIELGDRALPAATEFMKWMTDKVPAATRAWDSLSGPVKTVVIGLTALVALAGPLQATLGVVQILGSSLGALSKFAGAGALFAEGGMLAGIAGGPYAWAAIAVLVAAVAAGGYMMYRHFQSAAEQEKKLAENAEKMGKQFDRALAVVGDKKAVKALSDLRQQVADAGDDTVKLSAALDELAKTRKVVLSVKMDAGSLDVARASLDQLSKDIRGRLSLNGADASAQNTPRGIVEATSKAVAEAAKRAKDAGVKAPPMPEPKLQLGGVVVSGGKLARNWEVTDADARAYAAAARKYIQDLNNKVAAITKGERGKWMMSLGGEIEEQLDSHPKNQARLNGLLARWNRDVERGWKPNDREKDVFARLKTQIAENAKVINQAAADNKKKAKDDAADAAAAQQKVNEETNRRVLAAQQKTLGERAAMWDRFASQVEGALGRVRQIEEQGGEMGVKTAMARVEAELLKRAYDGIPEPLKASLVALAGIEERMKRMLGLRDGFRQLFEGMYGNLSGAGRQQLSQLAAGLEARLGQGNAFRALQAQKNALGGGLVSTAEGNRLSLKNEQERVAESLRASSEVYEGGTASATGIKIADEAMRLQLPDTARKFARRCDALADMAIRNATSEFNSIVGKRPHDSAAKTMGRFQKAGIGQAYTDGMKLLPGDILYSGSQVGNGSGHVMIYGANGKYLDQYGQSANPKTTPNWVVRAGGAQANAPSGGGVPLISTGDPRGVSLPADIDFLASLNRMRDLPKAWGGMVRDRVALPGESTQARQAIEDFLMQRYAEFAPAEKRLASPAARTAGKGGAPLSPQFLAQLEADRQSAKLFSAGTLGYLRGEGNKIDISTQTKAATDAARSSIRQMGAEIRAAANDNNPYAALLDSFETGENRFLNSGWRERLKEMTLGKMVEATRSTTREMRRQISGQFQARQSVSGLLGEGFNDAQYERASFIANKSFEIDDSQDIRHLRDVGKGLEAAAQAQMRFDVALKDFDSQKAEAAMLGYAQSLRSVSDEADTLKYKLGLVSGGMNAADADIETQVRQAEREVMRGLEGGIATGGGGVSGTGLFGRGGGLQGGGLLSQLAAGKFSAASAQGKAWSLAQAKRENLSLGGQTNASIEAEAYDRQTKAANALLEKRRMYASVLPNSDASKDAEREIQLLQKQQELEERNASLPASERLSPEAIAKRVSAYGSQLTIEREIQRSADEQNTLLGTRNAILDQEMQRQQSLARTAKERAQIEIDFDAQRRMNAGRAETAAEAALRVELEGYKLKLAAEDDLHAKLQKRADLMKSGFRSLLDQDFKGILTGILDRAKDSLSAQIGGKLSGLTDFDRKRRGGGLLGRVGLSGADFGDDITFGGKKDLGGIADTLSKVGGLDLGDVGIPNQIKGALNSITINQATVTIMSATIRVMTAPVMEVSAGVVNTGGGSSFGLGDIFGGAGRNGAPGTNSVPEQDYGVNF